MLNVILKCHVARPHALSHEVSAYIYIYIYIYIDYTHHLCKKIIIHHIIYIKKIIHINFKVHCKMWIARVLQ